MPALYTVTLRMCCPACGVVVRTRPVWAKGDQVFLAPCGHQHGEAARVDANAYDHRVIQLLADYQDRVQVWCDQHLGGRVGLGDGWLRLPEFDMGGVTPRLHVRTYSTHYDAYATDLSDHAAWYKADEAPHVSDEEFLAKGDVVVRLQGFRERFRRTADDDLVLVPLAR